MEIYLDTHLFFVEKDRVIDFIKSIQVLSMADQGRETIHVAM